MKSPQKLSKKQCISDLYKVLGVSRHASPREIARAFEEQYKNFTNDHQSLSNLKATYAILINPELRAEYDAYQDMGGMKWSLRKGSDIMDRGMVLSGSFGG